MIELLRATALVLLGLSAGSAFSTTEPDIAEEDMENRWKLTIAIIAVAAVCAIVSYLLTC